MVWAYSRILLAVSKDAASAIAIFTALNVLIGSALVAYGRRVRTRPASFPLLVLAALLVIGAGVVALSVTEGGGAEEAQAQAVSLSAKDIQFSTDAITVTAEKPITLSFDNQDAGIQHNVAIFQGADASAPVVFRGELVTGVATVSYSVRPLKAGDYFFHCDVHPTMQGTITAGAAPPGGEGQSGAPPGAAQLSANNLQFSTDALTVTAAGGKITIHFENKDTQPHNVAVFNGADATAPAVFRGDLVQPGASSDYTFDAPPPGTYFFHCDVHPTMQGTLTVAG
jgi:plastocyanin